MTPKHCAGCGKVFNPKKKTSKFCESLCKYHNPPRRLINELFWRRVVKAESCWIWNSDRLKSGYGILQITKHKKHKKYLAHRLSWKIHNGDIPEGLCVLHKCDVPCCVNPDHLFLGTSTENNADRDRKNRQGKGEQLPQSKLTEKQVLEIRKRYASDHIRILDLAAEYAVTKPCIQNIVNRKTWKHLTLPRGGPAGTNCR